MTVVSRETGYRGAEPRFPANALFHVKHGDRQNSDFLLQSSPAKSLA
jgi:hypothetical protein